VANARTYEKQTDRRRGKTEEEKMGAQVLMHSTC
jgi:hypothetical protein